MNTQLNYREEAILRRVERARQFIAEWHIGKIIRQEELDEWAIDCGYYTYSEIPPKVSSDWGDMVRQRVDLRKDINRGALLITDDGWEPFSVDVYSHNLTYKVEKANRSANNRSLALPRQLKGLMSAKYNQITALVESVDMDRLTPLSRHKVNMLKDEMDDFETRVRNEAGLLERRMDRLQQELAHLQLDHPNGGLRKFVGAVAKLTPEELERRARALVDHHASDD